MKDSTLLLFTKQFPYGPQETYLFNELPYLINEFKKVVIIPYDEFSYLPEQNRIKDIPEIEIFCINNNINKLNVFQKLKREFATWYIMLFEILKGREALNHLKYSKRTLSHLRHSFTSAKKLNDYIIKNNFKNILFYNYWLHGGVVISSIFNKFISKKSYPIISRAHAYDVYHKDWYTLYPTSKFLFLGFETWKVVQTDLIFPISTHAYNHFIKLFPKFKSKFKIARLGVMAPSKINEVKLSNNTAPYVFVSCSYIDERKRIYRIPELLAMLDVEVKWIHFGPGSITDVEKLQKEIDKFNLGNSCTLAGLTPNSEVINFYKNNKVDLIINLSQIEGIPVSLMEAASFGIPMVATKTVGNPEIVSNENGFLIEVDFDTPALADQLNIYFNDKEEIESKKRAAKATFLKHYDASKNYPDFIKEIKNYANEYE